MSINDTDDIDIIILNFIYIMNINFISDEIIICSEMKMLQEQNRVYKQSV